MPEPLDPDHCPACGARCDELVCECDRETCPDFQVDMVGGWAP